MTTRDLIFRIARSYGKWPHEVAQLPFHYYLSLRDDWIRSRMVASEDPDRDGGGGGGEVVDFNAASFTGERT